jgi:16S rRNA (cytosine1402-N4)-methyltransferase
MTFPLTFTSLTTLRTQVRGAWLRLLGRANGVSMAKKKPLAWVNFLMAGRDEEQGTAPLPPIFLALTPTRAWAMAGATAMPDSARDQRADHRKPTTFLMAGRGEEQGTAPLPPYHLPVLPVEVDRWMDAKSGDVIIDGTLGGGGHTSLFLQKGATVLGIDRDPEAIAYATRRLAAYADALKIFQANYSQMAEHPNLPESGQVQGILLDLGVSSHQLDCAERGFSFQKDGPLDMRMGPNAEMTAADFVNAASEAEMVQVLREFGEEPQARRVAHLIIERRRKTPFTRTGDLASCIESALGRHGRTHPATRTFQAIRMRINEELTLLHDALEAAVRCLAPGGRLLVITFHSLEDRMVKQFLQHRAKPFIDDPTWPAPRDNPEYHLSLPVRKSISAGSAELTSNPRARSAKLRVAVRNHRKLETP